MKYKIKVKKDNTSLVYAYDFCLQLARSHYENFPVASLLVPQSLRGPIAAIYAFARRADDIADEGDLAASQRLQLLSTYRYTLTLFNSQAYQGHDPVFIALADTVERHQLPISLLADLLSAFEQDITQKRYNQWQDVLLYCQHSANPIGRLLLHLNQTVSEDLLQQSDAVCTALQLINFFQDIKQDYEENNRIYLPQEGLDTLTIEQSIRGNDSATLSSRIRTHYLATLDLMTEGYTLGTRFSGRLGLEIRTITLSGLFLLKQLSLQTDDNLFSRPRLSKQQMLGITCLAITNPTFNSSCQHLFKQISSINKKLL